MSEVVFTFVVGLGVGGFVLLLDLLSPGRSNDG